MSKRLLFLIFTFLSFSCDSEESTEDGSPTQGVENAAPNTLVQVDTAHKKPFYLYIKGAGKVQAHKDITVKAEASGLIQYCRAKSGQSIKKGQLIVRLDQQQARLKLQSAQIAYQKAELDFESNLIGYPKLLAQENPEKDSLYQKLKVASGLEENAIRLQEAKIALKNTEFRAPFSGTLYDVEVFEGKQVSAGEEMFSLFNHKLLIEVKLLESEAVNLKEGMPAMVQNMDMDKAYQAQVHSINPKVDENGLVMVHLALKDATNLWPGMNVTVDIKIPKGERLQVPKNSLVLRSGKAVVFSVEGELAKWNYVEYGLDNGEYVEILEGIDAGTTVISSNNLQLAHDAPISVENSIN